MAEESPARGPGPPPRAPIRARLGRSAPFAGGAFVALAAVFLYGLLAPGTPPLTQRDVDETVASALASVTPPPAFSEFVYQAVQPSLVLIQTKVAAKGGKSDKEGALGSGVVVNLDGDILTSLHVVSDATEIGLTFADGTKSQGEVVVTQPEHDIAVIRATDRRPTSCPRPSAIPARSARAARRTRWAARSGCMAP